MKKLTLTDELTNVASRVIWFEPPEKALSDPVRFLTYAMTYGTHEDMKVVRQHVADEELREVLDQAPPPREFSMPVPGRIGTSCSDGIPPHHYPEDGFLSERKEPL